MDENRIAFLATPGGKTETIARQIMAERKSAYAKRIEYMKSKGAENLYGSDSGIAGIAVKPDAIPEGWRTDKKLGTLGDLVIVVPNGKAKATYKALVDELRELPVMPDGMAFSHRIGCPLIFSNRRMWYSYYEIIAGSVVVAVPELSKVSDPDNGEEDKKQFVPEDCVQLKHSEYYALKEKEHELGRPENLPLVS